MIPNAHHIWILRHTTIFACIAIGVLVVSKLISAGSMAFHLILLLSLLPFFGIPHGALDYALAKRLFHRRYGRNWAIGFLAAYLLIMALVLAAWRIHPTGSLAAFLALTFYHFGTGDAIATGRLPWVIRAAEVLGRGGTVLTFPAIFAQEEVFVLFSYLAPETGVHLLIQMLAGMAPLCALSLLVCLLWSGYSYCYHRTPLDLARLVDLSVLPLMFALLPALLAFTIYFNFLHSVRHMFGVAAGQGIRSSTGTWTRMFWTALPVTAATVLMGGGAYFLLTGVDFDASYLVRVIFIGIASMTYPHVAVVWLAERAHIISVTRRVKLKNFSFATKSSILGP